MNARRTPWRIARCVRLRTAGFPYQLLAPLEQRGTLKALEELEHFRDSRQLASQIDAIASASQGTRLKTREDSARKRVRRAMVEQTPVEEDLTLVTRDRADELARLVADWNEHANARQRLVAAAKATFDDEVERARRHFTYLFCEHQMRDAVHFSSPAAAVTLSRPPADDAGKALRKRDLAATMFVQRFCTKNDSISYYGPVFWGTVESPETPRSMDIAPREKLIARRLVSFEHWAMARLGALAAADPELQAHLVPRLKPTYRLEGEQLVKATGSLHELSADELAVVRAIAQGATAGQLRATDASRAAFEQLIGRGLVSTSFFVPTLPHAPDPVLAQLRALPESPARTRWLDVVEDAHRRLDAFAALTHEQHDQRRDAFAALESWFETTLGDSARRSAGKMYAGRTIAFEDCERGLERFALGDGLARELGSMQPLLDLCEWTTAAFGGREHARFLAVYRALTANGATTVPLAKLYDATQRNDGPAMSELNARKIEAQIEETWARYLDEKHPGWRDAEEVVLAPDALSAIHAMLPPAPPFPDRNAYVHSPDIMLSSPSVDALNSGDYSIVLGELHKAVFTTAVPWATMLLPDIGMLERDFVQWSGKQPVLDLAPPDDNRSATNWPDFTCHWQVDHEGGVPCVSRERLIPISEVETLLDGDLLYARRIGQPDMRFFLLECARRELVRYLLTIDPVSLGGDRTPRLRWGKFVLLRRRWRFYGDEIPRTEEHGFELFLAMRKWAQERGLPERVFVRVPDEPKPLYVDFANYHTIEMLAKQLRSADRASFSEMLPSPEGLWLSDHGGTNRYTCELRFTMYRPAEDE